ncbi:AfsR/SARP family transcriptional regulator [Kutzneria kofuensis]|uniref:DNA-binding SARP family transcriptional activator/predicted negative regulator of RcsB-dependent stress response n=1 Tax=Kutzneria kofuensis TaxID=103725 RepID=A0A7W9NKH2_9PSEU|nr:tetratricopeptide repeat protein [Kutzneria kofuensis]MBB5895674.1 DNA-binding SARP family transcriptional activator/predicted negative regulator of RcsB-dependent stress response [Kutzneria kofuensis]
MEFTILGPTRLHVHGVQVDLGTTKQRGLLALLLHDVNNSVPIDTLVGELWSPDRTFEQVRSNFHALVSRLRKALEKAAAPARIERDGNAYRISTDPGLIDLHRFRAIAEQAYESAARHDHSKASALLKEGLALWTPRPLAEVKGPWADHCREQLETFDRLRAHYALFDSQLALGENTEVLRVVRTLVRGRELDEELILRQMRALAALGQISEAIRVYNRFRERVADELGTDPGPELRALYTGLLRSERDSVVHTQSTVQTRSARQLPRAVPDFVGRADLLARLDTLLANGEAAGTHRVCTLHGMPGVGKTSLAVQWIDRNRDRFPDGQYSIDLRGYGPTGPLAPEDALSVLLLSLGDHDIPKSVDERQARIRSMLGQKRIALLFDNARDTSQVKPLLAAAPNCVILITSRDLLAGLVVHDHAESMTVSPLDAEESLSLLTSSLGPVRAAEDRDAVRHLASLTSGLPLALRIVTQRVVERPHARLVDLARELQRQDVLGALGSDDDEAATLAAPFSWSFQALSPSAAGTFAALGLLPGTDFSADAVCALLDAERSEVDQNLRALVRVNLLQHGTGRRFRLHQLLHGYAAQLAERTEAVPDARAAQRRMLDWLVLSLAAGYRRLVPSGAEIPSLPAPAPVQPMTFEDDSAVIAWASAESATLSAAVAIARRGFPEHCWRLAAYCQEVMDRLRMHTELLAIHRIGLDAARELGNSEGECGMYNDLGMINHRLGKYADAETALRRALAIASAHDLRELLPIVLSNLASVHVATGDLDTAVGLYEKALSAVQEIGTQNTEAVVIDQLANAYRKLGRDDEALELYRRALSIRENIGHTRGKGTTLAEMATLLHEHGENSEALPLARKALALHIRSGDRVKVAETQVTLAEIHYDFGSFDNTIAWADRSLGLPETAKSPDLRTRALLVRGYALAARGDHSGARSSWRAALDFLTDTAVPDTDGRVTQLRNLLRGAGGDMNPGGPEWQHGA